MLTSCQVHNNIATCYPFVHLNQRQQFPVHFPCWHERLPVVYLLPGIRRHPTCKGPSRGRRLVQQHLTPGLAACSAPGRGLSLLRPAYVGSTQRSAANEILIPVHTRQNRFEDPHHMLTTIWAILTKEHCLVNLSIITVLHLILRGFEYCAMIWISRSFYATLGFFSNQDMLLDIVCVISCCNTASFAGQQSVLEM